MDDRLAEALSAIAQERGWQFQRLPSDDPTTYPEGLDYLVAIGSAPGLSEWSAQHPAARVLAIGQGALAGGNVGVILPTEDDYWRLGFAGGYLAAIVSEEWRVSLFTIEEGSAAPLEEGFVSGVRYFCGLCQQYFPPFVSYPIIRRLAPNSPIGDISQALTELRSSQVTTLVLGPGTEEAGAAGKTEGLNVLSLGPAAEGDWLDGGALLVLPEDLPALVEAIGKWLDGSDAGGQQFIWSIHLYSGNPEVVSPGRLQMAEKIIPELLNGMIGP